MFVTRSRSGIAIGRDTEVTGAGEVLERGRGRGAGGCARSGRRQRLNVLRLAFHLVENFHVFTHGFYLHC